MKTAATARRTRRRGSAAAATTGLRLRAVALLALVGGALLAQPADATTTFRAGDVGFSIPTSKGSTWVYGDSWVNGRFVRNAMTLNGKYAGTIPSRRTTTWLWPGAPFRLANGKIAMYGGEFTATGTGSWAFKSINGFRAEFDPANAGAATVQRLAPGGIVWAAASAQDSKGTIVYGVDGNRRAHAGRPNPDGTVTDIATLGGTISGQFTVLKEPSGKWWMVGQLPFLSRRVVAYPLSGPTGRVTGPALKLITLPDPGASRWTYAATIHPHFAGLMTWAVNGTGPGTPYGLQKSAGFWPYALYWARAAAGAATTSGARTASVSRTVARIADSSKSKKGKAKGRQLNAGAAAADRVLLWASERQRELEQELERNMRNAVGEDWLGPLPAELGMGVAAKSGAPSTWEFSDRNPEKSVGEDLDEDRSEFLVPSTLEGWKAQQAAAKAAVAAAAAELKAASDRLKAFVEQQKAAEKAAKAAEKHAEAQRKAAEAAGRDDEDEAEEAERAAEAARRAAEQSAEQAKAELEAAVESAKQAKELAREAAKQANGRGRKSWDD